jgi:hypothetical protein
MDCAFCFAKNAVNLKFDNSCFTENQPWRTRWAAGSGNGYIKFIIADYQQKEKGKITTR